MTRARLVGVLFALVALVGCNDSSLPPGGTYTSFAGVVVDSVTRQPVAGATVTVDTVLSTTTDAAGKFSFERVPVGDVDYQVSAPHYKTLSTPVRAEPDKPLTVTVALTQNS